jgi:adenosylcobinamide-GDP ribazoletransferase
MKQLILAFQFLTIIPLRIKGNITEKEIAQSSVFFPVVGAAQGLLIIVAVPYLIKAFPVEIASLFTLLILILTNGGFHLDGLADTFDALALKSTGDKEKDIERRLSVMKDSTTGAIGVVAIAIVILFKYELIKWFLIADYRLLFLMPVFSRWIMVPAMYHGKSARQDGLGRLFVNNVTVAMLILSTVLLTLSITVYAPPYLLEAYGMKTYKLPLIIAAFLYAFSLAWMRFCSKKFNGFTGDALGALSEISEILCLLIIFVWLQWVQQYF